jgi:hypothetical protein
MLAAGGERLIEKDKSQYLTWLHGSGPGGKYASSRPLGGD